jgi:hypothetical protein
VNDSLLYVAITVKLYIIFMWGVPEYNRHISVSMSLPADHELN